VEPEQSEPEAAPAESAGLPSEAAAPAEPLTPAGEQPPQPAAPGADATSSAESGPGPDVAYPAPAPQSAAAPVEAAPAAAAGSAVGESLLASAGSASAEAGEPPQMSPEFLSRWQAARQAAWEGRTEESIEQFQALHQEQPANYDLAGEYGNVLLAAGRKEDAAEIYYQTALYLAADGYDVDAMRLMWTVKRLNPERGVELERHLVGMPGGTPSGMPATEAQHVP